MSDSFTVPDDIANQRLDRVLVHIPSVGSRSRARKAIETGKVSMDGEPVAPEAGPNPVPAGAVLSVNWNQPGTSWNRARANKELTEAGLVVLYQDRHVVAIDKPPGLLTDTATRQQARERDSVRKRLHAWLTAQGDAANIVHRIDRDTSGVVLLARNDDAADSLRSQFRERRPERVYRALVWGAPEEGEWVDWMAWDRRHRQQMPTEEGQEGASRGVCHARIVHRFGRLASEIEVALESGRRNQIRLQAKLRGSPLLGEVQYRREDWAPPVNIAVPRQCLHASRLTVRHPDTHKPLTVEAPEPTDYQKVKRTLQALADAHDKTHR